MSVRLDKNLSTVDAVYHVLDFNKNSQVKYVLAVFHYISGAFDCLRKAQLVKDMRSVSRPEGLIKLTKSYFDRRQAQMKIGDQTYATNPLLSE